MGSNIHHLLAMEWNACSRVIKPSLARPMSQFSNVNMDSTEFPLACQQILMLTSVCWTDYLYSLSSVLTFAGMIVPYVVAYSMMWGAIASWGIMWPLLTKKEGDWYPAGLSEGDFRGLFGYKASFLRHGYLPVSVTYLCLFIVVVQCSLCGPALHAC